MPCRGWRLPGRGAVRGRRDHRSAIRLLRCIGREQDAGEDQAHADQLDVRWALTLGQSVDHQDDRIRGADRSDDAHRPDGQRLEQSEQSEQVGQAAQRRGGDGAEAGEALAEKDNADAGDDNPPQQRTADGGAQRQASGPEAAEECGTAPPETRHEGQCDRRQSTPSKVSRRRLCWPRAAFLEPIRMKAPE
mgnify:CR=1 FL=1